MGMFDFNKELIKEMEEQRRKAKEQLYMDPFYVMVSELVTEYIEGFYAFAKKNLFTKHRLEYIPLTEEYHGFYVTSDGKYYRKSYGEYTEETNTQQIIFYTIPFWYHGKIDENMDYFDRLVMHAYNKGYHICYNISLVDDEYGQYLVVRSRNKEEIEHYISDYLTERYLYR